MMKSSAPPNAPVALPPQLAAYVEATNSFGPERLMATFAEDALVNDQLRDCVTANVDYDKRGLPDPLELAFYFIPQSDLIVQLFILRNRSDI